jgi:hypothetical protein
MHNDDHLQRCVAVLLFCWVSVQVVTRLYDGSSSTHEWSHCTLLVQDGQLPQSKRPRLPSALDVPCTLLA